MSEKSVPSEHWEQSHFVSWFRQTFSKDDVRIFAIPNGGSRGLREGVKFKAEGVSPGVPDLFIPAWLVWVEMKRVKGGSVSNPQKDWKKYLQTINHVVLICRGAEDARQKIVGIARERGYDI